MTSEQRAYYEYGKAYGLVKDLLRRDRLIVKRGRSYFRDELVLDAWHKRAIARRTCFDCVPCSRGIVSRCRALDSDRIYNTRKAKEFQFFSRLKLIKVVTYYYHS